MRQGDRSRAAGGGSVWHLARCLPMLLLVLALASRGMQQAAAIAVDPIATEVLSSSVGGDSMEAIRHEDAEARHAPTEDPVVAGVLHDSAGATHGAHAAEGHQPEGQLEQDRHAPTEDPVVAGVMGDRGVQQQQQQQHAHKAKQQEEAVPVTTSTGQEEAVPVQEGAVPVTTITGQDLKGIRDQHYSTERPSAPSRGRRSGSSSDGKQQQQQQQQQRRSDGALEDSILHPRQQEVEAAQPRQEKRLAAEQGGAVVQGADSDGFAAGQPGAGSHKQGREEQRQQQQQEENVEHMLLEDAILHPHDKARQAAAREAAEREHEREMGVREQHMRVLRRQAHAKVQAQLRAQAAARRRLKSTQQQQAQAQQQKQQKQQAQQQAKVEAAGKKQSRASDAFAKDMEQRLSSFRQQQRQQQGQQQRHELPSSGQQHLKGQGQSGGKEAALAAKGEAAAVDAEGPRDIPVLTVLLMTLGMAAAAGLGALPFFFVRSLSPALAGLATAVACGVMFAASFDLIHEGQPYGAHLVVLGVMLGGIFIKWSQEKLAAHEDLTFDHLKGQAARRTVLMVGIMAAHAIGEGCGVGVSFVGNRGWAQGVLTTLAIGVHNIPEGLAKATVLVGQGVSPTHALFWSVATCLPQPLVALPAFVFVETFKALLPTALGFAAGCMIWMVFGELLPDALAAADSSQVASAATLAAAGLEGCRMFFESLETADGTFLWRYYQPAGDLSQLLPAAGIVLPAVALAAGGGGLLARARMSPPVALGAAAALTAVAGLGPLLRQLLHMPQIPALHTGSCALVGAVVLVLLRRQLLSMLGSSSSLGAAISSSFAAFDLDLESPSTVEAAANGHHQGTAASESVAYGTSYVHKRHPVLPDSPSKSKGHALPGTRPLSFAGDEVGSWPMANGGSSTSSVPGSSSKAHGRRNRAVRPQIAAGTAAVLALLVSAVPLGVHLGKNMVLLSSDMAILLLPTLLAVGLKGLAAGCVAAALAGSGWMRGAAAAAVTAAVSGAVGMLIIVMTPELAHEDSVLERFDYPNGINDSAEAFAAGALCCAAFILFAVGAAQHARRARGGAALGLLLAGCVSGLMHALCHWTPYCFVI